MLSSHYFKRDSFLSHLPAASKHAILQFKCEANHHCLIVDGRHLISHSAGLRVGSTEIEHNLFHASLRGVAEDVKLSVTSILVSERMSFLPAFVDMTVEVITGGNAVVNAFGIKALEVFLSSSGARC